MLNHRDEKLLVARPTLEFPTAHTKEEAFQNQVLRPILKMQNEALLWSWHRYAKRQKGRFYSLNRPEQQAYIEHALKVNRDYRSFVIGLICGVMTEKELVRFSESEKELTRRIITMSTQRLIGNGSIYLPE